MNTQTTSLLNGFSAAQLISLTTEVKETLAENSNYPFSKKFTAAQVWDIQRRKKSLTQRRFAL
ncbi:MAG: hypothetical protein ABIU63_04110 [Chitinophagaceae bacterium]